MKRTLLTLGAAVLIALLAFGGQYRTSALADENKILEWDTMIGVPTGLTGSTNPIRGINGGGLAWTIGPTDGELTSSGKLEINVHGLVFAAGPNTGSNTVGSFRAVVSCLNGSGQTVNLMTDPFTATTGKATENGGNATIEAQLTLPSPCIAPIVFVTHPNGPWFAATGQ